MPVSMLKQTLLELFRYFQRALIIQLGLVGVVVFLHGVTTVYVFIHMGPRGSLI